MRRMRAFRLSLAAVAATVILGSTACGGGSHAKVASLDKGSSSSSSSSSGASKQDFRDALLDFSKCMREHGVDMPDPTFQDDGNGGGAIGVVAGDPSKADPDSATFKAAQTACQPIMDAAEKNFTPPSPEEQAKMRDQALKFAQCMRDKGFDMPDPTFDDNGGMKIEVHDGGDETTAAGGDVAPKTPDPAFVDASKECSQQAGGGPGMGFTTKGEDE